jgi:hypothetical protein
MLLTPGQTLHPSVTNELTVQREAIDSVTFLGGTGAVSGAVRDQVAQVLR